MKEFLLILFIFFGLSPLSFGAQEFFFKGEVDFSKEQMDVAVQLPIENQSVIVDAKKNFVKAFIQRHSEDNYSFSFDVDHLTTPFFDISGNIKSSIQLVKGDYLRKDYWRGEMEGSRLMVDYKPFHDLIGGFDVVNDKLFLHFLSLNRLDCRGFVELMAPFKLDLSLNIQDMTLDDFLNFWVTDKSYEVGGDVAGDIKISGTLSRVFLKGRLASHNGFIKSLKYDSISLNVEGYYPRMQIADTKVAQSNGMIYMVDGPFMLDEHDNFKKQLKALSFSPLVSNSDSKQQWTLRQKKDGTGKTELKYLLREQTRSNDERTDMLGFEKTMEF